MRPNLKVLLLSLALTALDAAGLPFNQDSSLCWYDAHYKEDRPRKRRTSHVDPWGPYKPERRRRGDCSHYWLVGQIAGNPRLHDLLKRWARENPNPACGGIPKYNDGLPKVPGILNGLLNRLDYDVAQWGWQSANPPLWGHIAPLVNWRAGDAIWLIWKGTGPGHMIVIKNPSDGGYWDHDGIPGVDRWDDYIRRKWRDHPAGLDRLVSIHRNDQTKLAHCDNLKDRLDFDSSWVTYLGHERAGHGGYVKHQWICCWHENLANTWPWYADSSAYACLSWTQSNGTTWDTLVAPRMNFYGDSAVLLRQRTRSTLLHGGNKTIEIRGSTDNGVTWPYLIGDDTLTEASLPWATNQRNVRIAWIYKGPVQAGKSWCIDDVELWAKPTRDCDGSVSGVVRPCGTRLTFDIGRSYPPINSGLPAGYRDALRLCIKAVKLHS